MCMVLSFRGRLLIRTVALPLRFVQRWGVREEECVPLADDRWIFAGDGRCGPSSWPLGGTPYVHVAELHRLPCSDAARLSTLLEKINEAPRPVAGPRARMARLARHSGSGPWWHLPVQCAALHLRQPLHAGRHRRAAPLPHPRRRRSRRRVQRHRSPALVRPHSRTARRQHASAGAPRRVVAGRPQTAEGKRTRPGPGLVPGDVIAYRHADPPPSLSAGGSHRNPPAGGTRRAN